MRSSWTIVAVAGGFIIPAWATVSGIKSPIDAKVIISLSSIALTTITSALLAIAWRPEGK